MTEGFGGHDKDGGDFRIDSESGLFDTSVMTAADAHDFTQAQDIFHREETDVLADSGYRSVERREETKGPQVNWGIAMMPSKSRALNLEAATRQLRLVAEKVKVVVRATIGILLESSNVNSASQKRARRSSIGTIGARANVWKIAPLWIRISALPKAGAVV